MSPLPPHDPFQPAESTWSPKDAAAALPVTGKKTRTSKGVRFVFCGLIFIFVILGLWLAGKLFLPRPTVAPSALTMQPFPAPASDASSSELSKTAPETPSESPIAPAESQAVKLSSPGAEPGIGTDSLDTLHKQLADTPQPATSLFLELAAAYSTRNRHGEAAGILSKGILQHPGNDELFLALVDSVFASGDLENAWQQVARTARITDPRYASRILRFGLSAGKYDETLIILSSSGTSPEWSESEWIMIASLYENSGQLDKAIETTERKVANKSEIYRLRARQETLNENITEAIFNQEQYIANLDIPSAEAWRSLATLYASLGRTEDAARAQRQSAMAETGRPVDGTSLGTQ
ncbi:MAG: hypothetical protein KA152_12350 [Verrucomicrobiales bacterium]|nr:hypothetical protein [Verrucomicrobiales bacterium]